ncbi:Metallo-dependent phosphatase [Basidiobolus meristosporus CBS 931.73]|uniref:Metallo-dependent phosphatase n=1 Tax=Basidiobolus meristosporus CBS 931.73 TaxID=1314790 RepID=A0A1Y1YWH2_9FUNG|nr:Metallo-dependent phosphatase [Basidiobolus meristosporus CBS 931.73]|eukprot:ORY02418.1 Metallo-dependent phosphatase [Basidiobolus meristosporus CBS 931.73]
MPEVASLKFSFIHFNDVYHIGESKEEPVGGAARFANVVKNIKAEAVEKGEGAPLVLFSGDCFNPSLDSSITKGKHMVPVLNQIGVDVACYGNHDFDFGVPNLIKLASQCTFPWLISNVYDTDTGRPIADGKEYLIKEHNGLKLGFVGLVEKEWLDTIPSLPDTADYRDFIATGRELSQRLRHEEKVDLVIALTHMRLPNDEILARECGDVIDVVLGGHDHFYHIGNGIDFQHDSNSKGMEICQSASDENLRVIKSGTDFRELTVACVTLTNGEKKEITSITARRVEVTSAIEPCPSLAKIVEEVSSKVSTSLDKIVGTSTTEWDARSETNRTQETGIGNLAADIMRVAYPDTHIGFLCGGTIRSDKVYPAGDVTLRTIMDIFPFEDPTVVIRIKGCDLWEALENGVSMVPKQEGRFPHISGLEIHYNPNNPSGSRLVKAFTTKHVSNDLVKEPLDMEKTYQVATRHYMAEGYDGFQALKRGTVIVDEENGMPMSVMFRRYFLGLKYINAIKFKDNYPECEDHQRSATLQRAVDAFRSQLHKHHNRPEKVNRPVKEAMNWTQPSLSTKNVFVNSGFCDRKSKNEIIKDWATVGPQIEGRIVQIRD